MSELPMTPGGAGESPSTNDFAAWAEGLSQSQLALQQDLSCLADGELDEAAAARAMVQLEEDASARSFLDDVRRFARFHRDMDDPDRLLAKLAMLSTSDSASESGALHAAAEEIDLTHRLATIFYQLGKAYVLSAVDPKGFRDRVFESAVPIHDTQTSGRGFVDGVLLGDRARGQRIDWRSARHLLNGRLEKIAEPMDKGQRLLEQAIEVDPCHEEARIYLAWVFSGKGKKLRAADLYREVFETAIVDENRGHAAIQLGLMHMDEEEFRRSAIYMRWLSLSGLAARTSASGSPI